MSTTAPSHKLLQIKNADDAPLTSSRPKTRGRLERILPRLDADTAPSMGFAEETNRRVDGPSLDMLDDLGRAD
jgi:hypothetical protein